MPDKSSADSIMESYRQFAGVDADRSTYELKRTQTQVSEDRIDLKWQTPGGIVLCEDSIMPSKDQVPSDSHCFSKMVQYTEQVRAGMAPAEPANATLALDTAMMTASQLGQVTPFFGLGWPGAVFGVTCIGVIGWTWIESIRASRKSAEAPYPHPHVAFPAPAPSPSPVPVPSPSPSPAPSPTLSLWDDEDLDGGYFNWDSIQQFPHLIICGKTGSGKSTLAKLLLNRFEGNKVAVDPHAISNTWEIPTFGKCRNYKAIREFFEKTLEILDKRFNEREANPNPDPLTIVVDELPAIIGSDECAKIAPRWIKAMGREARKVNIRLLLLSQGMEVAALGLKGEGTVRENFTQIYLGNFALKRAEQLGAHVLAEAKELKLPCIVEDKLAVVPIEVPKS